MLYLCKLATVRRESCSSEGILEGRLVKYLMCEYTCTQFTNFIEFKEIKKFIGNLG